MEIITIVVMIAVIVKFLLFVWLFLWVFELKNENNKKLSELIIFKKTQNDC